ncbi:MAG: sensor histidine kinase [Clostridia bacterium]|nr:sensor histidine kinase [Clostridia bacterium]
MTPLGKRSVREPGTDGERIEGREAADLVAVLAHLGEDFARLREELAEAGLAFRRSREPALVDAAARLALCEERVGDASAQLERLARALGEAAAGGRRRRQDVGFSIIRAQEEERRRLARDIHDGPAQLLANVVFRIEVSQKLLTVDPERAYAEMEQLKTLVRQSLQDVRKIIFDLRPMALDDLGFLPALRGYLGTFGERSGLACDLVVQGRERRLPAPAEVALFRIAQEALNNVWKHADASRVRVSLRFAPDAVELAVSDDGVGFDLEEALARGNGFGLVSMRERAGLVGGELAVETSPGRGTTVRASFPAGPSEGGGTP